MAKDPAFLFYPGDASEDTQFMNRLERGCYFDLLKAQKKFKRFSIEQVKKVLGRDFEECWPSIEPIMGKDDNGFFIEWVDESVEKRKVYAKIQKDRIQEYWDKKKKEEENTKNNTTVIPRNNHGINPVIPLENENAIENENEIIIKNKNQFFLIPEMIKDFKIKNPEYPEDQFNDFPAVKEIAEKICKWKKLDKITETKTDESVREWWGKIIVHIRGDGHLCTYSLTRINKHFQSIIQSFINQKNGSNIRTLKPIPGNVAAGGFGKL